MSFIFKERVSKKIFVDKSVPKSVLLAAQDLAKDIRSVCGEIEWTEVEDSADIIIAITPNRFSREEEFLYEISQDRICFFGADDFGVMWAIYTFAERELKIPPFYLFDGITVEKKSELSLEEKTVNEYPHTKFRGWFVNDEDLLTGFKNQGVRDIDYRFYREIVHPETIEKIVETALRFRMNLIIPATFVDICNPAEENLVRIASERGLYVSQHHIEPLGVSHYGLAKFLKEFGYDEDVTYTKNPDAMVACWKHYAEKWAKYPRVVWQLGLRGKGDVPVWASDKNVGNTDKARGELISSAIQAQYDVIKAATGLEKIYTTSTVWMEGAQLLQSGYLTLPKDTVAVFADIGITQLLGDDFFTVPREADRNYGIYYHAQYWHVGPHLAEAVLPEKMEYTYALARDGQADYYSIMNVGNVKEFTFSINLNSKLTWYGNKKTRDEIVFDYCNLYAGEYAKELYKAILLYFSAFGDADERNYYYFCKRHDFNYHKYEGLPFPVMTPNDGLLGFVNHILFEDRCKFYTPLMRETARRGFQISGEACDLFTALMEKLPQGLQGAMLRGWRYQAYYWRNMFGISVENADAVEKELFGSTEKLSVNFEKAAEYAKNILEKREQWHDGEWSGWFNGEKKIDIQYLYEFCQKEERRFMEMGR